MRAADVPMRGRGYHLPMRLALTLLLLLAPTLAFADAIPGDDECGFNQHWEGHHDGECVSNCGVSAGESAAWPAAALALAGLALVRRRWR